MHYDYVIVGSGAAGSVLAERLSRDPAVSVLVLEAGGPDRNPVHRVPKGFYFTMNSPRYVKRYATMPYGDGRTDNWIRGRVVGGSTTINGMMWNRGWAPQYDAWEQAGNTGWNWARFLSAFRALEDHQLGGNAVRGAGGAATRCAAQAGRCRSASRGRASRSAMPSSPRSRGMASAFSMT